MGVHKDLKRAENHSGLADRVPVELVSKDGVVREAHTASLARPPVSGSTGDIPYANAAEAPESVVLWRKGDDGR
ncbi:hypothetical protein ACM563_30315 [Streptomyces xantholiticus]